MAKSKLSVLDRLMQYVIPEPMSGCWLWIGHYDWDGYGMLTVNQRPIGVHRLSYEQFKGPIPEGLQIDHLCRVRCCANPNHLEVVSLQENLRRGLGNAAAIKASVTSRLARTTHCPQGHPYSPENTYLSKTNRRHCKTCLTIRDLQTRASRKQYFADRYRRIQSARHASR